jgi:hypothetical protein
MVDFVSRHRLFVSRCCAAQSAKFALVLLQRSCHALIASKTERTRRFVVNIEQEKRDAHGPSSFSDKFRQKKVPQCVKENENADEMSSIIVRVKFSVTFKLQISKSLCQLQNKT